MITQVGVTFLSCAKKNFAHKRVCNMFMLFNSGVDAITVSTLDTVSDSYVLCINKCTAEVKESLEEGFARAISHLKLYAQMFGLGGCSLEIGELTTFYRSCETQFVRGNAEKAAKDAAEGFSWKEDELDRDGRDLARLGSISDLVN
jgi:hypothetical protein